jgi:hypothetical protein
MSYIFFIVKALTNSYVGYTYDLPGRLGKAAAQISNFISDKWEPAASDFNPHIWVCIKLFMNRSQLNIELWLNLHFLIKYSQFHYEG